MSTGCHLRFHTVPTQVKQCKIELDENGDPLVEKQLQLVKCHRAVFTQMSEIPSTLLISRVDLTVFYTSTQEENGCCFDSLTSTPWSFMSINWKAFSGTAETLIYHCRYCQLGKQKMGKCRPVRCKTDRYNEGLPVSN